MKELSRLAFGKEIINLGKDYDFLVMNADTKCCGLEAFGEFYPDRTFNFGIAEQNLFAACSGAAASGEKVIVSTFAVFASMRACEQVRTYICYPNLNVTIIGTHGGLLTGEDGATHIASEDLAIMRSFANMTVVEPSDAVAARKLAKHAIEYKTPLYIRFPKAATPIIHEKSYDMQIGKAQILIDFGEDIAIIAIGSMVHSAISAGKILKEQGIFAKVVEMHTLKPIDFETIIEVAKETRAIITVEDHSIIGGLGSAVSEVLSENCPTNLRRIGIKDCFGESGDPQKQYEKNKMTTLDIVNTAIELVCQKSIS